ncbi:hypothetical protein ACFO0N_01935 [Halobium salinum]|uniref:DUF7527 domain-containing protein n=1 Tax=Halobium salinum TaxID=1364940 RepID=A0ABD5P7K5_9EURY|nr:hypothetical protein [Halobium salinum]
MRDQTEQAVTGWGGEPFSGGYAGLHELADREFTGAVSAGATWAFLLNGKVVKVVDGTIEAFEGASGTAYAAPDPALPLLYAMQEEGGDVRAQYYTNDTPLSEVDGTLSSGGFTGYIELSENVLSGDYYVVYYGGKSMSVAYVGNSRNLVAGDEAFERADDEVGIYEVREVPISIVDVPEPEADAAGAAGAGRTDPADASDPTDPTDTTDDDSPTGAAGTAGAAGAAGGAGAGVSFDGEEAGETDPGEADAVGAGETAGTTDAADAGGRDPLASEGTPSDGEDPGTGAESDTATARSGDVESSPGAPGETPAEPSEAADADSADDTTPAGTGGTTGTAGAAGTSGPADTAERSASSDAAGGPGGAGSAGRNGVRTPPDENPFAEEAEWREATSIPALDPKESAPPTDASESSGRSGGAAAKSRDPRGASDAPSDGSSGGSSATPPSPERRAAGRASRSRAGADESTDGEAAELRERLESVRAERDEAERLREETADERDRYREEATRLGQRVEELEAEVDRLEAELADARAAGGAGGAAAGAAGGAAGGEPIPAERALRETNLFIRYDTKSGGTLEKAHAGDATREEVNGNLRIEHHTRFDAETATVDGRPFEAFLHDTIEFGFVDWVVGDLLYEIGETGNQNALGDLFDAIPKVDRAELDGEVTLSYEEEGEEQRERETFDVVFRDRMGNPLLVADVNDSRDPATEEMMVSLLERANRLKESSDTLGGAFSVTASYFDPGALETATDATGGGLFSRGKQRSFVRLSRKRGYHLGLVETREGNFHLNVPEL